MIKAIIFDCFGVLVRGTLHAFFEQYLNNDKALVEKAHILDHWANLGEITYDDFIVQMAELANKPSAEVRKFLDDTPANTKLLDYIRETLKPAHKIGMLSNAAENWLDDLFKPDDVSLFDDIVLSCEVGINKPNHEIFKLAARRLKLTPSECIMVDDIETYCMAAEETGMKSILYKNFTNLKRQFNDLSL